MFHFFVRNFFKIQTYTNTYLIERLVEYFPNHWIGSETVEWPPWLHELISNGFFLKDQFKFVIFSPKFSWESMSMSFSRRIKIKVLVVSEKYGNGQNFNFRSASWMEWMPMISSYQSGKPYIITILYFWKAFVANCPMMCHYYGVTIKIFKFW